MKTSTVKFVTGQNLFLCLYIDYFKIHIVLWSNLISKVIQWLMLKINFSILICDKFRFFQTAKTVQTISVYFHSTFLHYSILFSHGILINIKKLILVHCYKLKHTLYLDFSSQFLKNIFIITFQTSAQGLILPSTFLIP